MAVGLEACKPGSGANATSMQSQQRTTDSYLAARLEMVSTQLQSRGVRQTEVLAAMQRVPRECFVPEPLRRHAYEDRAWVSDMERRSLSRILRPSTTELLDVKRSHKVLEIGTGSGCAAVLSELARRFTRLRSCLSWPNGRGRRWRIWASSE